MKKRGLCILLSGMMIFSSAPYGGTKEVNGQVIRDIPNEKDSVYQGLSVVETGAASGEEKEVNRWICGCRNIKYFVKEERKCGGDSLYTATDKKKEILLHLK